MPDNKYERDYDRQAVLDDIKRRLIVLMDNGQLLPDTDIYDEPVRYFKANEKWTPILFGWLDWLEDVAGWPEAEDDNFSGIQQVLKFEEGIESLVTTQEELTSAICEGIECGFTQLAKKIVSGTTSGFTIDDGGNIVPPGPGATPLPEDDPLTNLDEKKASKAGAYLSIATGIIGFYEKLEELYGAADPTPVTPLADAQFLINALYYCESTINAEIEAFYNERATGADNIAGLNQDVLAGYLYCHGQQETKKNITNFIAESTTIPLAAKQRMIALLSALMVENFSLWYEAGSFVPSSQYADFPCEPIPTETFSLVWNVVKDANGIAKKNHRYLIKTEGILTDTDGDIQDTWYYVPSGGSPVFSATHFNVTSTGFTADATAAQVPYRADHKYEWTYERDGDAVVHYQAVKNAGMSGASTGELTVTVKDLGEFLA